MTRPLRVHWLGRLPYGDALARQEQLVAQRRHGEIPDTLLLLEHPPVITLGRAADADHVLAGESELARRGITIHECGRGGDVTFHGPGQLVGYPIVELCSDRRDAHRYLRDLERALIESVAEYGVRAHRCPGLTGVWVGEEKLAAIGVRLSTGWITSHGFALNVGADLSGFSTILPCGVPGRGVTSLARLGSVSPDLETIGARVAWHLARALGLRVLEDAVAWPARESG